jgi:serine/threonine-protein kinase
MAPEQWAGAPASPSTDIYAATATFFECLVGAPPYRSPGDLLGLRKQHEEAPIPIDAVPEPVRGLVRRGLAKKVEHRPKDAATFLYELEQVAGAGYGPEWEEEGRSALARRAALLLLLFPLAGLAAGGTGAAKTVIGWSNRSLNMLLASGATLALLIAGGAGWYFTQDSEALPPVLPIVESPTPTPETSPTPSPTPEASPTASPSASPSRSPSRPPSPPTPNTIQQISVPQYDPRDPNPGSFCWYQPNFNCHNNPDNPYYARATISVGSTTGAGFTLHLRFSQVYYDKAGIEREHGQIQTKDVTVPAGAPQRTVQVNAIDLSKLWLSQECNNSTPRIKLTITASIPGGVQSVPVYIRDNSCPVD